MKWGRIENGDLLNIAGKEGFEVLVTGDKNSRYQQNLTNRKIATIELSTPDWDILENQAESYVAALDAATLGSYQVVQFSLPPRRPKPFS